MINLHALDNFSGLEGVVNGQKGTHEFPRITIFRDGSGAIVTRFYPENGEVSDLVDCVTFKSLDELQDILVRNS